MICPHCHKETDTTPAEKPKVTRKKIGRTSLGFDPIPLPVKGQSWSYHECYFKTGDKITWRPRCDRKDGSLQRGVVRTDTVAKIKRNQFGRVSYYTDKDELVFMEEVQEAM